MTATERLSSLAEDMCDGYQQGFSAGLNNLASVAGRTMVLERTMKVQRNIVWKGWMNKEALPRWRGPDGFSRRMKSIDRRTGGAWVFDMIGPGGTVFPNHHRYIEVRSEERIAYTLLWGENGPKHADAWA